MERQCGVFWVYDSCDVDEEMVVLDCKSFYHLADLFISLTLERHYSIISIL